MTRDQERMLISLWVDWCKLWPEQYARDSLAVKAEGYDPVFDVIPSQAYKDFYYEVVRGHPKLKMLNAFEVVDVALNQIPAPEVPIVVAEGLTEEASEIAPESLEAAQNSGADAIVDLDIAPEKAATEASDAQAHA